MTRATVLRALLAAALPFAVGCQGGKRAEPASAAQAEPAPRSSLLEVGDPVPAFEAVAHDGTAIRSKALAGRPAVIYFYPRDATPG